MKRRDFLAQTGAAAIATGLFVPLTALAEQAKAGQPHAAKLGWKVSVQHWSYRRVPLFEGLEMAAKVGLQCFEPRSILKLSRNLVTE